MAKAEAWFEEQRREHLAVEVEYRPSVGIARFCRATLVTGRWEAVDKAGNLVRMETRDFFIHRDELPQDPKRGDRIVVDENGAEKTYEVSIPDGSRNAWRWADRSEKIRRIHTMAVAGSTAVPNETLLVRAIGVSTAAAITDQQIAAQLQLDMATNRTAMKQLVANAAYVYVVVPASFGEANIDVNGFRSTAWEVTTRSIAFTGQASRSYRIYRSTYPITGSPLVEVS
jgi:hypothetical protein